MGLSARGPESTNHRLPPPAREEKLRVYPHRSLLATEKAYDKDNIYILIKRPLKIPPNKFLSKEKKKKNILVPEVNISFPASRLPRISRTHFRFSKRD